MIIFMMSTALSSFSTLISPISRSTTSTAYGSNASGGLLGSLCSDLQNTVSQFVFWRSALELWRSLQELHEDGHELLQKGCVVRALCGEFNGIPDISQQLCTFF